MASKKTKRSGEDYEELPDDVRIELTPSRNLALLPDVAGINRIKDYSKRIIYLTDDIDDDELNITNDLYRWDREDTMAGIKPENRTPVVIFINNYGGDLIVAYSIISAMEAYQGRIITINASVACSAAALIFLCGTKGYRYCTKYSFTLIHQGSGGGGYGTYSQQEASQKNYTKMIGMMEQIVLGHTNIDPKVYRKNCTHENYYYAQDCVDLGICDKIITDMGEIWKDLRKEDFKPKPKKKSTKKETKK